MVLRMSAGDLSLPSCIACLMGELSDSNSGAERAINSSRQLWIRLISLIEMALRSEGEISIFAFALLPASRARSSTSKYEHSQISCFALMAALRATSFSLASVSSCCMFS